MPNTYITSDTHFGWPTVLTKMKRRGFTDIEDHDTQVLDAINTKVRITDLLVILGDFSLEGAAQHYRDQIRCRNIYFIKGNHDDSEECQRVFGDISDTLKIKAGGVVAVCCHYPMAFWDDSHRGSYHFYGHCHGQREFTLDTVFPERRSMDVGVDMARIMLGKPEPFSLPELKDFLYCRKGHDPKEFYI